MNYASLHNHTDEGSNLRGKDSIINIPTLVKTAVELGYKGVAMTDHECLTGTYDFSSYVINQKKDGKIPEDFKFILGNEIYLVDSVEDVRENYVSKVTKFYHFILLAKNLNGFKKIKAISSLSAWHNFFKQGQNERVPTIKSELASIIGNNNQDVIATSACLGGELPTLVLQYFRDGDQEARPKIHNFITWCINTFGKDNFYLELQPHILENTLEPIENEAENADQIILNKSLVQLAKGYGLKCIVATDSHYPRQEHRGLHAAFLKSDDNDRDRELGDFYANTYLMSIEEIYKGMEHLDKEEIDKALENTMLIHSQVEQYTLDKDVIVPSDKNIGEFEVKHLFKQYYSTHKYINNFAQSSHLQDQYLLYLVEQGFIKKNRDINSLVDIDRIELEFETWWEISENLKQRMSGYYVLVRNIVHEIMWKVSFVGVSRGSSSGSFCCYLIEITQLDPIKYSLPFWRHAHVSRPELADIDLDTEQSKRYKILEGMQEYFGADNVLNTLTLKTSKSRATIQDCGRGLGINNDDIMVISDMIPFERGQNWSLSDCLNGNEEKGRKAIPEFIKAVEQYPNLKEYSLMMENLVTGRSIHASAVYIFDNGYLENNSLMKSSKNLPTTAYNMHASDSQGALKFDALTIKLDILHKTLDLLVKYGKIEPCDSIKELYDKNIHPDVLDYDTPEMWQMLNEGRLLNAFQFDTQVGAQAIKKIQPQNLQELAISNSLMRLVSEDGAESPIDTYAKFKQNIGLWYEEMDRCGLMPNDIKILEDHLLEDYGICAEQETIMEMAMNPKISNFTMSEANKLRKGIAKKVESAIKQVETLFFNKGREVGTSEELLKYVWNVQFRKSFGYSFSKLHTLPYSTICLQEMNLAYKYGTIFWNTAVLSVEAGESRDGEESVATDYAKIAKAIGTTQAFGQVIELPDINKAQFNFEPDLDKDTIIFGLKGIEGINDELAFLIADNRPYTSFDDFYNKMQLHKENTEDFKLGDGVFVKLIKAGCFDKLESCTRVELMECFIRKMSAPLKKLGVTHIDQLIESGRVPQTYIDREVRYIKFKKYVFQPKYLYEKEGKSNSTFFYYLEPTFAEPFFNEHFEGSLELDKHYRYTDDGKIVVKRGALEKVIDYMASEFVEFILKSPVNLDYINEQRFLEKWNEKASGTISKWEMDALNFYYTRHELADIDTHKFQISDFNSLPETPEVESWFTMKGDIRRPRWKLTRLVGTVLDKKKDKHIVSILTPTGVVDVKFYKATFGLYDKQISEMNEDGSKTILERSWFSRGTKVMLTGYRRDDRFIVKTYKDSLFKSPIVKLLDVTNGSEPVVQSERVGYGNQ